MTFVCSPSWTWLVGKVTPRTYIRTVCWLTTLGFFADMIAIWQTHALNIVLLYVSAISSSGLPLLALGWMGLEEEISEVRFALCSSVRFVTAK